MAMTFHLDLIAGMLPRRRISPFPPTCMIAHRQAYHTRSACRSVMTFEQCPIWESRYLDGVDPGWPPIGKAGRKVGRDAQTDATCSLERACDGGTIWPSLHLARESRLAGSVERHARTPKRGITTRFQNSLARLESACPLRR